MSCTKIKSNDHKTNGITLQDCLVNSSEGVEGPIRITDIVYMVHTSCQKLYTHENIVCTLGKRLNENNIEE